jgi:2-polyprenyl-3-methyl-5-hydroxy-6-metoxy-1,4-benzoquinol methylase
MPEETLHCPICDSQRSQLWGTEYTGYRILKCRECGLRYLDPAQRHAKEIYDENYFDDKATRMIDPEKLLLVLKSDADSIAAIRLISAKAKDPKIGILDIGTGRGSFLILCKLLGYNRLVGTDVTRTNAEFLNSFGIALQIGDITELDLGQFDIVTFHHVLEHIPEPKRFLKHVSEILPSEGIGHLLVPNEGSLNSRVKSILSRLKLKKRAYKHLSPGHHLWFFEKRTLVTFLDRCGFEAKYIGTRAHEKKRGIFNRLAHWFLDLCNLNTWLEIVITKKPFT